MPTIAELFDQALRHHQSGQLGLAEHLYRQVLQADPRHAEAWHFLGLLARQVGRPDLAAEYIGQALRFMPHSAEANSNLGVILQELGRLEEAEVSCRAALRLKPGYAEAHYNLGNVLRGQGKLVEAEACFHEALRLDPNFTLAHSNLGIVLWAQGKLDQAEACCRAALRLKPDFALAHANLGIVLRDGGKLEDAAASLRAALRLKPDHAEALTNLGDILCGQRELEEAEDCFREALRLRPDSAPVHNNLGIVLRDQGRLEEAEVCCRQALLLKPDYPEAHMNLGNVLGGLGRLKQAEACYREGLRLKPDHAEAYSNLGSVLCDQGKVSEAAACYRETLRLSPDNAPLHSNLLLALNYDHQLEPAEIFAEHRQWGQRHGQKERVTLSAALNRDPERRLRIGYVAPDFRRDVVMRFLEPVLASHDPRQVEVLRYAEIAYPNDEIARSRTLVDVCRWTGGISAHAVADWIVHDKIDILVDLAGHTKNNRLDVFALKPAPVQVTWLGYPNTTGLTSIDYRLTDANMDPPGRPVFDTEELFRLPRSVVCFMPRADAPPIAPLPALTGGQLTFGSLHKLNKLNARVYDLWCRVLEAVPRSKLLMFRHTLQGKLREAVVSEFLKRGIAKDRLDLRQEPSLSDYLNIYRHIDISLDTIPYSGGTTTCESLWMGVPMLSLAGRRPAARGSATLLTSVGLNDWIAATDEEFVALARRWAQNLEGLSTIRAGLRDRMRATLCDGQRFTRELEDAYRTMWRRWCASK